MIQVFCSLARQPGIKRIMGNIDEEVVMNEDKRMIAGYIVGGLLVLVLAPFIIYSITWLFDRVFRVEMIQDAILRWTLIIVLLVAGLFFGIWSVVVQNTIGKGGPVEIGNFEVSPKTKNLVVSGPYQYTRNPMLFGTFLAYLAIALLINSLTSVVLVAALFTFMLTVVVKMEEKRLLNDFGIQYEEYRKKVALFIPWFHRNAGKKSP